MSTTKQIAKQDDRMETVDRIHNGQFIRNHRARELQELAERMAEVLKNSSLSTNSNN